jgi:hypothetical protein
MPSSSPEVIPVVLRIVWELAPRSVLDVGAGYGKYGVLFREYLELRHRQGELHRLDGSEISSDRRVRIDALEGYRKYVGPLHALVYDQIHIANLLTEIEKVDTYDLAYMGDILEHLEKQQAREHVLPALLERMNMGLLISVPANASEQDATFGNELEIHRSVWTAADLRDAAPHALVGRRGSHLVAFLSTHADLVNKLRIHARPRRLSILKRSLRDSW